MPRYFFHLKSPDGLEIDEIGLNLPNQKVAHTTALGVMAEMAGELMQEGRSPLECSYWITDDRGALLSEVPFPALLDSINKLVPAAPRARVTTPPNFNTGRASRDIADRIFRQQFEASLTAHLVLTPDLTIVAANDRYRTMTGAQLDQLVGRDLFDAFPENDDAPSTTERRNVADSFLSALTRGRRETLAVLRYDVMGSDGVWRERYWRTEAQPIYDDYGSTIGLDISATDLTRHMGDLAKWRQGLCRQRRRGSPTQGY
jgi:PAS domain S-box-containing protein